MENHTLVIGHRGAAAHMPENTMASFELAFGSMQADMIEFDVQRSREGIPVVIHDETLERTTNGAGLVSNFPLEELKKLDAAYWHDPLHDHSYPLRGKGIGISTLEEVLIRFRDKRLAIEIKDRSDGTIHSVLDLAARHADPQKTVIGSLHDDVFLKLASFSSPFPLFTSRTKVLRLIAEYHLRRNRAAKEPRLVASMPVRNRFFDLTKAEWIKWLKGKGITVYYWTVNQPALMEELCRRGADGIMSDDPGLLGKTLTRLHGTAPTNV